MAYKAKKGHLAFIYQGSLPFIYRETTFAMEAIK
jgi:hypothetical protein